MTSKKTAERIIVFFIFLIAWLLVDEKIKEGYYFRSSDLTKFVTHEMLIAISFFLTIISFIIYILHDQNR